MKKLLILDNAIDHDIYQPVEHFKQYIDIPFDTYHVSKKDLPKSTDIYSHVLITGSEASIIDDYDWLYAEENLVRTLIATGKNVLGSCYGHQLIARAYFGKNCVQRRKEVEVGWLDINISKSDPLFGEKTFTSFVLHFDNVCNLPTDKTDTLLYTNNCTCHGFKLKEKPVWGIQAHPEIDINTGKQLLRDFLKKHSNQKISFENAIHSKAKDSGHIKNIMKAFLSLD